MRNRRWWIVLSLACLLVSPAGATRTLFRANVRVSARTYRVNADPTIAKAWNQPATDAVLTLAAGDTVRFMPVFPNPYTVQPDTINYRGTWFQVAALEGSIVVWPFGPTFRRDFRLTISADSESLWTSFSRKVPIDSLYYWSASGAGGDRCYSAAH